MIKKRKVIDYSRPLVTHTRSTFVHLEYTWKGGGFSKLTYAGLHIV